jgi:hypothetical protein
LLDSPRFDNRSLSHRRPESGQRTDNRTPDTEEPFPMAAAKKTAKKSTKKASTKKAAKKTKK